jgi:hypothetical protein
MFRSWTRERVGPFLRIGRCSDLLSFFGVYLDASEHAGKSAFLSTVVGPHDRAKGAIRRAGGSEGPAPRTLVYES